MGSWNCANPDDVYEAEALAFDNRLEQERQNVSGADISEAMCDFTAQQFAVVDKVWESIAHRRVPDLAELTPLILKIADEIARERAKR